MGKIERGRLCKYPEEMNIGDYISCGFRPNVTNHIGVFFNLGDAEDIPYLDPSKANTNKEICRFDFIKVDENIFIADRVIKTNIDNNILYCINVDNNTTTFVGLNEIQNKTIFPIEYETQNENFIIKNSNNSSTCIIPFAKNLSFKESGSAVYSETRPANTTRNDFLEITCKKEQILKSIRIKKLKDKYLKDYYIKGYKIYLYTEDEYRLIHSDINTKNQDIVITLDRPYKFKKFKLEIIRGEHEPIRIESIELYDRDIKLYFVDQSHITGGYKYGSETDSLAESYYPRTIGFPNNNDFDKYIKGNDELFNNGYFFTHLKDYRTHIFTYNDFGSNNSISDSYMISRGKSNKVNNYNRDADIYYNSEQNNIGIRPKIMFKYYNQSSLYL